MESVRFLVYLMMVSQLHMLHSDKRKDDLNNEQGRKRL